MKITKKKDAEKFFKAVKGKEIALSAFPAGRYFIPKRLLNDGKGSWKMYGVDEDGDRDYWWVDGGFSKGCWSLGVPESVEIPDFRYPVAVGRDFLKVGCHEITLEQALIFHAILEDFIEGAE